ncbi:MAG: hypothetical protein HY364_02520 [Candidatus Aenigmarchaeota archaeon]|nr:hypothetical protein [Candidatus Aenigmarchaeota archaeon]
MNIKVLAKNAYQHVLKPTASYLWEHKSRAGPAAGLSIIGLGIGCLADGTAPYVNAAVLGTSGFYAKELCRFAKDNPKEGIPAIGAIIAGVGGYSLGEIANNLIPDTRFALGVPPVAAGIIAGAGWHGIREAIRQRYP